MNIHYPEHLRRERHAASLSGYMWGYALSLLLTLAAFLAVATQALSLEYLLPLILVLAFLQLIIQLVYFLHLGKQSRAPWNLAVFLFSALVVCIIIFGSLWIMEHLNRNMSHADIEAYMERQN